MIRKIIKSFYLSLVKFLNILFLCTKVKKNQVVIYATFTEDIEPIIKELKKKRFNLVLFYHPRISKEVSKYEVKKFRHSNKNLIREMFYLSTSKWIIIDTYYLILGGLNKKKGQKVIQTWHAVGALKRFGLEENNLRTMDIQGVSQYKKVYNSFDYILAGSDIMGEIFINSFGLKNENIFYIGLPRMDKYYECNEKFSMNSLKKKHGIDSNLKIVTYMPTFRDYELDDFDSPINFEKLNSEWYPIIKLHPATKSKKFKSSDIPTSDLIHMSDVIITDYSSLAMEASILNKSIIFYPYDYEIYNEKRGLIDNYFEVIGDEYFINNTEMIAYINNNIFKRTEEFRDLWNKYNKGNSTQKLVEFMEKE